MLATGENLKSSLETIHHVYLMGGQGFEPVPRENASIPVVIGVLLHSFYDVNTSLNTVC